MKDRLFFDTNIVLDLLGERAPFYDAAAKIATLADKGQIELVVSVLTNPTVYFLLSKFENKAQVKEKIRKFKVISETSDLTDKILEKSLTSKSENFEDALQYYCAIEMDCKMLITRNGRDFVKSEIPVLTPDEYLNSLKIK